MHLRYNFLKTFDSVLQEKRASEQNTLALLLVRFKDFNEIVTFFGFDAGDKFLDYIDTQLMSIVRNDDVVSRVGDSDFAVLLPELHNQSHAILAVHKIIREFKKPFVCDAIKLEPHITVGVVIPENGETNNSELMQNAYQALARAEKRRSPFALYELSPDDSLPPDLVVENEISGALANDEFNLHYQPKFDLRTGKIVAAEALIRWVSTKMGPINTQYFIDVLEKSDLLMPVSKWVVNTAICQLLECQKMNKNFKVAVNLSAALFVSDEVVDMLLDSIKIWGIDPSCLILEVTESAMMDNPELSLELIKTLHEAGFEISIDDFGTGYSSLSYLKDLPANELKIDMSFVKTMHESPRNKSIATSTVQLAHNLGMKVTAEGVENEKVLQLLVEMDCDLGQGYHLARPMPFKELKEKLSL